MHSTISLTSKQVRNFSQAVRMSNPGPFLRDAIQVLRSLTLSHAALPKNWVRDEEKKSIMSHFFLHRIDIKIFDLRYKKWNFSSQKHRRALSNFLF